MTFSWPAELRKQALHLVRMSKDPAFEEHARFRRDELLSDPVWAGLREEIVLVMREGRA